MPWLSSTTPLILGHRGASGEAPENTLAAFSLAKAQGADGVELDVRLSADGNVVVIHDATVDRTTNGSGRVGELTVPALRELDAGMGQPVPTLDDVFQQFGPSLLYNVELKDFASWNPELELAVADRISAYQLENHVVVSSFNPLAVRRARAQLPRTTMVAVIRTWAPRWLGRLVAGARADHPHHGLVDEAYMAWAQERGLRVHVWTVDDPEEARVLAKLGVHAIMSNYPERIARAIRK